MANPNNVVYRICERPSCRAQINKGQPCYYVQTIEPGKAGCHVCAACYARYQTKSVTSMKRPTASYPSSSAPSTAASDHRPDPQMIRQTCADITTTASINPPPVVAVPDWINAAMDCTQENISDGPKLHILLLLQTRMVLMYGYSIRVIGQGRFKASAYTKVQWFNKTRQGECPRLESGSDDLRLGVLSESKFQVKPSKIKVKNYIVQRQVYIAGKNDFRASVYKSE
ncbi:hypothetical protein F4604DRAFT_1675228 [Suillus subluteus]|nr:hypothetical protein F4604DRAFT_1675228 [Suillus subluteus]